MAKKEKTKKKKCHCGGNIFWSGVDKVINKLGWIIVIYLLLSNGSGTYTYNSDRGIALFFKNVFWAAQKAVGITNQ